MVPLQARALVAPVATVVAVVAGESMGHPARAAGARRPRREVAAAVAGESMGHRERSRERVDFGIW